MESKMLMTELPMPIKIKLWRSLLIRFLVILTVCVGGCATLDSRVYHTVRVFNSGKSKIVNVEYLYGELGAEFIHRLGLGGASITKWMRVPQIIEVKWVTEYRTMFKYLFGI